LAAATDVAVIAVDTNGIVPLSRLCPAFSAAAELRPRIHRAFAEAWECRAAARARVIERTATAPPFEPAPLDDLDGLVASLPLDRSVAPVRDAPGGTPAARRRLADFVAHRLRGTSERRSRPAPPAAAHHSGRGGGAGLDGRLEPRGARRASGRPARRLILSPPGCQRVPGGGDHMARPWI